MAHVECSICHLPYDNDNHQPRSLPCGHSYCVECINTTLVDRIFQCPSSNCVHTIDSANELPVNIALVNLLEKLCLSTTEAKTDDLDEDDDLSGGPCPKHCKCELYFTCNTHNIDICRECTVLIHQPWRCKLISFTDKIKQIKKSKLTEIDSSITKLNKTKEKLENHVKVQTSIIESHEKELEPLKKQIKDILQNIEHETQVRSKAENFICQSDCTKENLLASRSRLEKTKLKDVNQTCQSLIQDIQKLQLWEDKLQDSLDFTAINKQFKEDPHKFLEIVNGNYNLYGVDEIGVESRWSHITTSKGKIHLHTPSKGDNGGTAIFIPISDISNMVPKIRPEVFMTLMTNSTLLGTFYVSVRADTDFGKHFLTICSGILGPSYKGASFSRVHGERGITKAIFCSDYIKEDGNPDNEALLPDLQKTAEEERREGRVFWNGAGGFLIITSNWSGCYSSVLGEVISGLDVVRHAAAAHNTTNEVVIIDCGVVLESKQNPNGFSNSDEL